MNGNFQYSAPPKPADRPGRQARYGEKVHLQSTKAKGISKLFSAHRAWRRLSTLASHHNAGDDKAKAYQLGPSQGFVENEAAQDQY